MKAFLGIGLFVCSVACIAAQLSGSISSNPGGGQDANLLLGKRFGTDNANMAGGLFASGNTLKGPVTTGGFLSANKNGHGLSLQHSNTPGFGKTLGENAHVNLFKDGKNKFDATAFHSRTNMENGFKFDKVGGGFNYNHAAGHAVSLSASRIPQLGRSSVDLMGKANLWSSPNRQTTLDMTGTASRSFGGGFPAQNNFGAGLGLTHMFG